MFLKSAFMLLQHRLGAQDGLAEETCLQCRFAPKPLTTHVPEERLYAPATLGSERKPASPRKPACNVASAQTEA
jgi:hypothetical protein